jgi:hypothetical protein
VGRKKKSFWLGVSARVRSRPRLPASAGRQSRDKTIRNTRNRISMSVDPFSTDSGSDGALGFTPLRARSAPLPTQAPEGPRAPCLKVSSFRTRALRQNAWAQR